MIWHVIIPVKVVYADDELHYNKESKSGPFDADVVACATCGENEATHEIRKGYGYSVSKTVYSVAYSVCGPCAREVVEVKLNANLSKAVGRRFA
jgi:hypothetical protein